MSAAETIELSSNVVDVLQPKFVSDDKDQHQPRKQSHGVEKDTMWSSVMNAMDIVKSIATSSTSTLLPIYDNSFGGKLFSTPRIVSGKETRAKDTDAHNGRMDPHKVVAGKRRAPASGAMDIDDVHRKSNSKKLYPESVAMRVAMEKSGEFESLSLKVGGVATAHIILGITERFSSIMIEKSKLPEEEKGYRRSSLSTRLMSGVYVPKVSLANYLARLVRIINDVFDGGANLSTKATGVNCLLIATLYIEKAMRIRSDFHLCEHNIHRVFFAAVIAALKFTEDELPNARTLAEIGGIDLAQATTLEKRFCGISRYSFWLSESDMERMHELYIPVL